jgi:formamidopyrimidine-DNA glycosylase
LPLVVKEIAARGKRIVMILNDDNNNETAFVFFYAMTGRLSFVKGKYTQLVFIFNKDDEEKRVYYEDKRPLGFVKYITTVEELYSIFKNIGPDYLRGEVSLKLFSSLVKNKRIKNKKIGEFLMNQKHCSGVGNYLRAEILYDCNLSPHRTCSSLSDSRIAKLYVSIMKIIIEAYEKGGLTIGDYHDPYGNPGRFVAKVYGNKSKEVITEKDGQGRTIWWCPSTQK